mmetsp:Transcript_116060/g.374469  ORF Transcript_116060/g.374469 Transcript_116060/m.374469 type:complete len:128 (+) Transcript_116060:413-796(+)
MWDELHRPLAFRCLRANPPRNHSRLFFPLRLSGESVLCILVLCSLKIPAVEMDMSGPLMNASRKCTRKGSSCTFRWVVLETLNGPSGRHLCLGRSITSCSTVRWIPEPRLGPRIWLWTPALTPESSP